jgi:hypothetical protein
MRLAIFGMSYLTALVISNCLHAEEVDPRFPSWIERAVASTAAIENADSASYANYQITYPLSRAGDAARALESAMKVTKTQLKLYALKAAAEAAHNSGDTKLCREIVAAGSSVDADQDYSFLQGAFLDLCFAAGLPEEALLYAERNYDPRMGPNAYLNVVTHYCSTGNRQAAEQIVEEKQLGDQGYLAMMRGFAAANQLDEAEEIGRMIKDPAILDQAHTLLATSLMRNGDMDAAKKEMALIKDPSRIQGYIPELTRERSRDLTLDELSTEFKDSTDRNIKSALLPRLVQELIKVNAFDEASQGIDEAVTAIEAAPQPEATSKFGTYGDIAAIANVRYLHLPIADALIEKNQRDAAAEQYKKASEALDMLPPEAAIVKSIGERHRILTLVKLDRIDDAIEVVEHLPKTGMNAKIATPIAVQLIKNGETDKALAFMESIPPMPIDNSERGEIAAALFDAHGVDRCLDYMASLDESEGAARAWQQLARVFAEQKRFDDLEKLYAAIDSKFGKAHVAIEVATRLQYPETKP